MTSTAAEDPAQHSEARTSPKDMIKYVHENGMLAGIAVKPETSVEVLWEILENREKEEVPDVSSSRSAQEGHVNARLRWYLL